MECSATMQCTEITTYYERNFRLRVGYTFFSSDVWSKFSQCFCIVTRECHIPPESLCRELSKFTHYFDLVAMVTLLALWLAKHGNGCNYLMTYRTLSILGWCVRYDNAHKTVSLDFLYSCHGNQALDNQVILRHNSNLKNKIKNPICDFPPFEIWAKTFQKYKNW